MTDERRAILAEEPIASYTNTHPQVARVLDAVRSASMRVLSELQEDVPPILFCIKRDLTAPGNYPEMVLFSLGAVMRETPVIVNTCQEVLAMLPDVICSAVAFEAVMHCLPQPLATDDPAEVHRIANEMKDANLTEQREGMMVVVIGPNMEGETERMTFLAEIFSRSPVQVDSFRRMPESIEQTAARKKGAASMH